MRTVVAALVFAAVVVAELVTVDDAVPPGSYTIFYSPDDTMDGWDHRAGLDKSIYNGGTLSVGTAASSVFSILFAGTSIEWWASPSTPGGACWVVLDGNPYVNVWSWDSSLPQDSKPIVVYRATGLSNKNHTLSVVSMSDYTKPKDPVGCNIDKLVYDTAPSTATETSVSYATWTPTATGKPTGTKSNSPSGPQTPGGSNGGNNNGGGGTTQQSESKTNPVLIAVPSAIGGAVLVGAIVAVWVCCRRKRRKEKMKLLGSTPNTMQHQPQGGTLTSPTENKWAPPSPYQQPPSFPVAPLPYSDPNANANMGYATSYGSYPTSQGSYPVSNYAQSQAGHGHPTSNSNYAPSQISHPTTYEPSISTNTHAHHPPTTPKPVSGRLVLSAEAELGHGYSEELSVNPAKQQAGPPPQRAEVLVQHEDAADADEPRIVDLPPTYRERSGV